MCKTCKHFGCGRPIKQQGYCWGHVQQYKRHGATSDLYSRYSIVNGGKRKCTINGCTRKYYAKNFCHLHYNTVRAATLYKDWEGADCCSYPECKIVVHAKGMCYAHYNVVRAYALIQSNSCD